MSKFSQVSPTRPSQKIINKGFQKQFIYDILTQEQHSKKHKTKQNLTRLIQLYRKLVEHYSQKNDNIMFYFTQKMSQASMEIATLQQPDEKLTMSMAREAIEEENVVDPRFKTVITTPIRYDPQIKKKERSKNAQIAIQVNKIKKRANARTILKSYYDECIDNNILINQDLQNQRKQLQQKLLAIRYKSFEATDRKWEILAEMIKTRTPAQVRSHTQKFFEKMERDKNKIGRRPCDLQLAKENSSIRKTRGMAAKVKRTSDDNYQESDFRVQKRLNYIIISPSMQYDTLWGQQKDSEVKTVQVSKAPTVADHGELGRQKKIQKEKRGRQIAPKSRQQNQE